MSASVVSIEKLQDAIDKELAWRKQELLLIRSQIYTHSGENNAAFILKIRSSIALLYAHWEGSIKRIAQIYLNHIFAQKRQYGELRLNFIAAAIKGTASRCMQSEKVSQHTQYLAHFANILTEPVHKLSMDVINTESNLTSRVLVEILTTIGIEQDSFEADYKLIDHTLVKIRNDVAHGEVLKERDFGKERYVELHDSVMKLIVVFAELVKDSAINESYLKSSVLNVF